MKRFLFSILGILLTACSIVAWPFTPTPIFPTNTPLPTVVSFFSLSTATPMPRASSFNEITAYPKDKFLFLEVTTGTVCAEECHCRASNPYSLPFRFEDGKLYIRDVDELLKWDGGWANARKNIDVIGLVYFEGEHGPFIYITIPYWGGHSGITGVDIDGNILIETTYGNVMLEPGSELKKEWVKEESDSCQIFISQRIKNYGFVDDNQVILVPIGENWP